MVLRHDLTSKEVTPGVHRRQRRRAAAHEWVHHQSIRRSGYLDQPFKAGSVFHGWMREARPLVPACTVGGLWIFRSEPAGREPGLELRHLLPLCAGYTTKPVVAQKPGLKEAPPSFLAENDPLSIAGIAPKQVSDASYGVLLYHKAVFDGKARLLQSRIVKRIPVKAGEEIGVGIWFEDAVALQAMCS